MWIVYFLNSKSHVDLNLDGWIDSGGETERYGHSASFLPLSRTDISQSSSIEICWGGQI